MRRFTSALDRTRLGPRGAFLLCLAALDLVYGWGLLHPTAETMRGAAYEWRVQFMPTQAWGLLWILVGLFIGSQAWSRIDRISYTIAVALKFAWAFIAYASWIFGAVQQGWNTGTIFLSFGACTLIASLYLEPSRSRTVATMRTDLAFPDDPTEPPGGAR